MDYYIGAREVSAMGVDAYTGERVEFISNLPEATFVFKTGEELAIPRETFHAIAREMGTVESIDNTLMAIAVINDFDNKAEKLYRLQESFGTVFTGMCIKDADIFCLGKGPDGQIICSFHDKNDAKTYIYDRATQDLKEFRCSIAEKKERQQNEKCLEFFKSKLSGPEIKEAMEALHTARALAVQDYKGSDILILCNYIVESYEKSRTMRPNNRVEYALAAEFAGTQCIHGNFDAADILKKYKGSFNAMLLVNDYKVNKSSPAALAAINMRVQKQTAYTARTPGVKKK